MGYLNLLGSLIHNFLDGFAIGIAYATRDRGEFIPVFVAIVAHEVPREMGDVAILLKNDFTEMQTILCNGVINLISIVGVVIGLAIQDQNEVVILYLLVFVAGNFIYIAAEIWQNLFKTNTVKGNGIEFLGLGLGIAVMYLLTLLEDDDHGH